MAANSRHWADVREWIYKVIDSFTTISQLLSAKKLIRRYEKQYPCKEIYDYMYNEHQCLLNWWNIKFENLVKEQK